MMVAKIIAAWLLADLLSGVFHWLEDRYGNPSWPILGEHVVKPNILHHEDPKAMLAGGYWHRNWTTILPAMTLAVAGAAFATWWVVLAFVFLSQANQVHAWAHCKPPVVVQFLQRANVFIRATDHHRHHRHPFSTDFCTMSPLLNPVLSVLRFWQAMEAVLAFAGIPTYSQRSDQNIDRSGAVVSSAGS